jgi:branched-chain amino acid transport system substrate-binding protein
MLKQMKALGIGARFVSGDGVCSEKLPQLAGDALGSDKVFCVVAGGVSGAQEEAGFAAFTERYRQRYKIPLQTYAPYAYDATMVFAAAMQQADSTDPAKFLPALAKISYHGVTGTIAFDPSGDLHNAALTLYTYRNGKQVKLQVVR